LTRNRLPTWSRRSHERAAAGRYAINIARRAWPPRCSGACLPPSCRSCRAWTWPCTSSRSRWPRSADFYDLFELAGGRSGFFLGDICGKGAEVSGFAQASAADLVGRLVGSMRGIDRAMRDDVAFLALRMTPTP